MYRSFLCRPHFSRIFSDVSVEAAVNVGQRLMPAAAVSGAVTAASGLVAQEAVEIGDAHNLLVTHRNLNAGLVRATIILAMVRAGTWHPGAGYLLAGAAATTGMFYTAYLGG
jgi:hypothetical protein